MEIFSKDGLFLNISFRNRKQKKTKKYLTEVFCFMPRFICMCTRVITIFCWNSHYRINSSVRNCLLSSFVVVFLILLMEKTSVLDMTRITDSATTNLGRKEVRKERRRKKSLKIRMSRDCIIYLHRLQAGKYKRLQDARLKVFFCHFVVVVVVVYL